MKIIEIFENTENKLKYLGADYAKLLNKEKELKREQKQIETEYHFAKDLPTSKLFNKYIDNTNEIIDKSDDMRGELTQCFQLTAEAISKQYMAKEEYTDSMSQIRDWAVELVALSLEMDKDTISVLLSQKKLTKRRIRETLFERKTKLILEDYLERRIDINKSKPILVKRLKADEQWEHKILNDLTKQYYHEQMNLELARKAQRSNEDILPELEEEEEELIDSNTEISNETTEKQELKNKKEQKEQIHAKSKIVDDKIKSKKQELEEIAEFAKKTKKKAELKSGQDEEEEEEDDDDDDDDDDEKENQEQDNSYVQGEEGEEDPYLDNLMDEDEQE